MGTDKLDTVRKLLAKADGAATPAEAEIYTAKAVELMARHGIDEALLAAARPEHGRDRHLPHIAVADPYSAGKARLLAWTASALRCRAVLHEAGGGRVAAVTVLGFASDRARVELLYTSLLLQASTQLAGQRPAWAGESVAAYRRSWLHGFAVRVHRRLVEAEARAAEAAAARRPRQRRGRPRGGRWRSSSPIAPRGSTRRIPRRFRRSGGRAGRGCPVRAMPRASGQAHGWTWATGPQRLRSARPRWEHVRHRRQQNTN